MNCCAHTASTERRELSRIAAWIRASRCLAQNRSEATAVGNWPSVATRHPSTEPSASRRATAERSSPTVPVPIEADSSSRVTGPSTSRWPRAAATNASSREQGTACAGPLSSLWSGSKRAPPTSSVASSRHSVATHRAPAAGSSTVMARPECVSTSIQSPHSGRDGASTSEQSRSCSSSALRSSGLACSTILATTPGSSAARSWASSGSPRRVVTARVRRSSSGASSRKV